MHTQLTDGQQKPVDYAAVAVERGLDEIGFSDHAPLEAGDTRFSLKLSDMDMYISWVQEARERFPKLSIKIGLEVDYLPGCENWVRKLAQIHPWDYFLGSVHFLGDWPIDTGVQFWKGRDVEATWRAYFHLWKHAAQSGLFDSLAHPDLPKKFGYYPGVDFSDVYLDALQTVARNDVAVEVSTAGLRKPCREIYPSQSFLEAACSLNIPVTLGSDAHRPNEVGQDFGQAIELLRACGYQQLCRFNRRKRERVCL